MPGSLIRSAILGGAAERLRAHGRQGATLARRSGLPPAALHDPDLLVPAPAVLDFFERAAQVCGEPDWGLRLAQGSRLAAILGPLWILLRHARTVEQMCTELATNFDLYTSAAVMRFEPAREYGLLSWTTTTAGQASSEVQMAEYALSLFAAEIRGHLHRDWVPVAVLFRHAAPAALRLHRACFGSDLRFDQPCNGLMLDRATLDAPLQGAGPAARALARRVLRLEEAPGPTTALQVESVVRTLMPYAPCTIDEVARALGLPPRTLQDHLQQQGSSFSRIKDAVRADLAMKYLRHSRLGIGQIAEVLGYADLSAFSRSFRRWHGQSARAVRARAPGGGRRQAGAAAISGPEPDRRSG
jgi:AraC-like DNA-binding protein